jgi:hypothetical protein
VWDYPYDCGVGELGFFPPFDRDHSSVSSGLSRINDFPLVQPVVTPYTNQATVQSLIGGPISLSEAVDDGNSGSFQPAVLATLIATCSLEVDAYLSPIYRPPYPRRFTVGTFRVLTVDSNGAFLTIENRYLGPGHGSDNWCWFGTTPPPQYPGTTCGYYLVAPATTNSVLGGMGTGGVLGVTFTSGPPFSVSGVPTIISGGSGYKAGDLIGLVGGGSYLPAKVQIATTIFVCEALYKRRLAPGEENPFAPDAASWRGSPAHPGLLVRIGHGEIELDADWPRSFSPGFATVERNRLNANSL